MCIFTSPLSYSRPAALVLYESIILQSISYISRCVSSSRVSSFCVCELLARVFCAHCSGSGEVGTGEAHTIWLYSQNDFCAFLAFLFSLEPQNRHTSGRRSEVLFCLFFLTTNLNNKHKTNTLWLSVWSGAFRARLYDGVHKSLLFFWFKHNENCVRLCVCVVFDACVEQRISLLHWDGVWGGEGWLVQGIALLCGRKFAVVLVVASAKIKSLVQADCVSLFSPI